MPRFLSSRVSETAGVHPIASTADARTIVCLGTCDTSSDEPLYQLDKQELYFCLILP